MANIDQWIRKLSFEVYSVRKRAKQKTETSKSTVPPDPWEFCFSSEKRAVSSKKKKALAGAFSTCGHSQCAGGCIHRAGAGAIILSAAPIQHKGRPGSWHELNADVRSHSEVKKLQKK